MIASLRGTLVEATADGAVVEAGGVGYAVALSASVREGLPPPGSPVFFHVIESVAMYGGGVSLYGFPTIEEKAVYLALKDNVPGAGAKKALELLDKASKSLPDFRRAVVEKDVKRLVALFGFTSKTAEKLVAGLRDKLDVLLPDVPAASGGPEGGGSALEDALLGLVALGYRDADARDAARSALGVLGGAATSQALIKDALRRLAGR